jgi:hypothetical protein
MAIGVAAVGKPVLGRSLVGASALAFAGRGIGLLWTVALVARLGLAEYGLYAMAFSASSLLASVIDSPFYARSGRINSADVAPDCTVRTVGGLVFILVGLAAMATGWYVPGFAAVLAGGEASLGSIKARAHRQGRAGLEQGFDLARQLGAIACGMCALLVLGPQHLGIVSLAYAAPYGITMLVSLSRWSGPLRLPPLREFAALSTTSLIGAGYAQLDVILVGALLGPRAAGAYALATLTAWALAVPGMQLATTRIPELRVAATANPGVLRALTSLGIGLGVLCLVAPVAARAMLPSQLVAANCLALLAPFVTLRTLNWYLSTVAVFQQRDTARLRITVLALLVDVALLLGLAPLLGATAASLAAVGADVVLFAGFARTTGYRPRPLHFVSFGALAAVATASAYVIHYPPGTLL